MRARCLWLAGLCGGLLLAAPARGEPYSKPLLFNGAIGFGIEPQSRVKATCDEPQCKQLAAFSLGAEVLWRGLVGPALAIYASEGQPIVVASGMKAFGDRLSIPIAVAVRPLAPLAWRRGDGWAMRLLAGIGVQVGVAVEHARIALEAQTRLGFHAALLLDLPIWGAGTTSGVALRVAARLRAGEDARLLPDARTGEPEVVGPGTAVQLTAGLAWYM